MTAFATQTHSQISEHSVERCSHASPQLKKAHSTDMLTVSNKKWVELTDKSVF